MDPDQVEIPFKVLQERVPGKKKYSLRVIKPSSSKKICRSVNSYPLVCLKREMADNDHVHRIMLTLNHRNILSMKALSRDKVESNGPSSLAAFVEPYTGLLSSLCFKHDCWGDRINHIPSPLLQSLLRQVIEGLDFLRKNKLYHGNLNWDSILYLQPSTVKLANFRKQEHHFPKIFRTALPAIKEIVLGHPLFWDLMTRVNFFAKDISLRLNDDTFMSRVRASKIRKLPWNEGTTQDFKGLLFEMETYRKDEGIPAYDFRSLKDYHADSKKPVEEIKLISDVVRDSPHKIFIAGIPRVISSKMLRDIVSSFGQLAAYRFLFNEDLGGACAFLEYIDHSITSKACAGLNGMKLGGCVITAVGVLTDHPGQAGNEACPFHGIPANPKPLLAVPTQVLQLKNVFDQEEFSLLSKYEVDAVLEDVRVKCARYGAVKSINVVEYPAGSDNTKAPAVDARDNALASNNTALEAGCILVEFLCKEASFMAAHSLHGRPFGSRIVSAGYAPYDLLSLPT
uniref:RRM domain-containing protein n=1 Tax=Oryza nivara TaxID=4536 RepID=A0A0E0FZ00_ORYNI